MFKRKTMKDAYDKWFSRGWYTGFSCGWDAAPKALKARMPKQEPPTEENELQWEAMTNGRSTNPSEEN